MTPLVLVAQVTANCMLTGESWMEFLYARYEGRRMTHAAALTIKDGVPQTLSLPDVEMLRTRPEEFFT